MTQKTGRPALFKSEEDILKAWEEYKKYVAKHEKPVTWSGMAYYLGIDRKTLYNYRKDEAFFPAVKRIQSWIEMIVEEQCVLAGSGAIFLAKNYGYTDKQEVQTETTKPMAVNISFKSADEQPDNT